MIHYHFTHHKQTRRWCNVPLLNLSKFVEWWVLRKLDWLNRSTSPSKRKRTPLDGYFGP